VFLAFSLAPLRCGRASKLTPVIRQNARAESFMKTLKVEDIYIGAYETFQDIAERLPRFIEEVEFERQLVQHMA
jgi:hypothetical protein